MKFNLLTYNVRKIEEEVILYYKGTFDDKMIAKISHELRSKFSSKPKVGGKVFSIFLEIAQNIASYSAEVNCVEYSSYSKGVGVIFVYREKEEDQVTMVSGNLVENNLIQNVIDQCNKINKLDKDGLRKFKKIIRSRPVQKGDNTGKIGLIQIALKSENPLHVQSQPIDEKHSFFTFSTAVGES